MNPFGLRARRVTLGTALLVGIYLLSVSAAPAWAAAGTITDFPVPPGLDGPLFITAGPDSNLWFTAGNAIGRLTTAGRFTAFRLPMLCGSFSSTPQGITAGPDGNLWFTKNDGNKIGRINPR